MSLRENVGEISGRREQNVEWKVLDVYSILSEEVDSCYRSPIFDFSDRRWYLELYPNGQSKFRTEGWIGLYLVKGESSPAVKVHFMLGIKTSGGKTYERKRATCVFKDLDNGWGKRRTLEKSELVQRRDELMPSNVLTILATLKMDFPGPIQDTLSRKLKDDVRINLKSILLSGEKSDVLLKVGDREFSAHRLILETRSPVFAAMFHHDMEERKNGVVRIPDIEEDVFEMILSYIYSGEVDGIPLNKVYHVFAAADKYDLQDLKQWCVSLMEDNLSVDNVCTVLSVANKYMEKDLKWRAEEYFGKNSLLIIDTDQWKEFVSQNGELAIEILVSIVKESNSKVKQ